MVCSKNHRYFSQFSSLPYAQDDARNDRHKCAGCAYVNGVKDALNSLPLSPTLPSGIPDSQAGTVRHKDAYQAYREGYQLGMTINS